MTAAPDWEDEVHDRIAEVPWAYVFHAYGPATDTPSHLLALAAGDDVARAAAVAHMVSAIVHQGTLWPASPDALRIAGDVIGRRRLPPDMAEELAAALAEAAELLPAEEPESAPALSFEATLWCWQVCASEDDFEAMDFSAPECGELMTWAAATSRPWVTELQALLASPSA